jgi:cytochrome o ubiquinol oxidase operon protein cyoD
MSETPHKHASSQHEHGTTSSYVIGFVLSLIFTFIPYHLVVNKVISGTALLVAILGIALLQMLIQIFFFLHLGRGPKPLYNVVFFFATAGIIVIVIGASLMIMNNLYHNMTPTEVITRIAQEEGISQVGGEETGACQELKESHIVTIKDGKSNPVQTRAQLCDTLTFVNEDKDERKIVFGSHPDYESYGGIFEVFVSSSRPETITLNQLGEFIFHDHNNPDLYGFFAVSDVSPADDISDTIILDE